jgi:hypothetical protein
LLNTLRLLLCWQIGNASTLQVRTSKVTRFQNGIGASKSGGNCLFNVRILQSADEQGTDAMTRSALMSFCVGASTMLMACKPLPGAATYSGGDGSSIEKAVIVNAANESQGLTAEYVWLGDHYPGLRSSNEHLIGQKGHSYDQFDIVTKEGQNRSVYFDITPCFGK